MNLLQLCCILKMSALSLRNFRIAPYWRRPEVHLTHHSVSNSQRPLEAHRLMHYATGHSLTFVPVLFSFYFQHCNSGISCFKEEKKEKDMHCLRLWDDPEVFCWVQTLERAIWMQWYISKAVPKFWWCALWIHLHETIALLWKQAQGSCTLPSPLVWLWGGDQAFLLLFFINHSILNWGHS